MQVLTLANAIWGGLPWTEQETRLLHSPNVVAMELAVGYGAWPFVIDWSENKTGYASTAVDSGSDTLHSGLMRLVEICITFQKPLTVSLHSPNARQNACRWGCARRLWKSLGRDQQVHWELGHVRLGFFAHMYTDAVFCHGLFRWLPYDISDVMMT